ncbi:uncharacterized protein LOC115633702 [Scaptodrosophila lebanonensis]|uniref:Uncharacterized protein LOC115633702 n=1 Tax=Drosophila lebanonensis TaxID=7225 RepID=A0A6J2UEX6_DROLE|nr:uncharacterized protein LOC115633702 [Scaptodrosophila lebanonensis]
MQNSEEAVLEQEPQPELSMIAVPIAIANTENEDSVQQYGSGQTVFKKIFKNRKKASIRIRNKKRRLNRQMRKSIKPKNALQALNEIKNLTQSDFTVNNNVEGGYTASVTVNSNQYEGKGNSKTSAKISACEKAFRDYIISKITSQPKSAPTTPQPKDTSDEEMANVITENAEEECFMINLASYAIFKLYSGWQREGFTVPELPSSTHLDNCQPGEQNAGSMQDLRSQLRFNWETTEPVKLLWGMRPDISNPHYYRSDDNQNVFWRVVIVVDDQEYTALGRSKKIARRNVAITVCNRLFGTHFPKVEI